VALRVLEATARGRRLDLAFDEEAARLDPRDRRFARELTFGVTRLRGRLDHILAAFTSRPPGSVDPGVLQVLRLAAYELLYMEGVPAYATVSEAVDLAGSVSRGRARGFVNGVLRALGSSDHRATGTPFRDLFPSGEGEAESFLTQWGSHPRWLVERWLRRWSPDEVGRLVERNNLRPPITLAPLDVSADEAVEILAGLGVAGRAVGMGTECLELEHTADVVQALQALPAVVQDPGAHLVIRYADIPSGMNVADLCAAPGGKAVALSRRAAYTLAADVSSVRLRLVRENAERTGADVGLVVADARHPPIHGMDAVLLDVPCSGTGTLRRHPDAKWRLREVEIGRMADLQREMLEAVAPRVRPGGLLVYSTCTLEPEENEMQIQSFLDRHPEYRVEDTGVVPGSHRTPEGFLRVLPQATGFDGAFAARLRRLG